MEIGERLRLSESSEWLACFREGMFIRFYDAHLGWFVSRVNRSRCYGVRSKSARVG